MNATDNRQLPTPPPTASCLVTNTIAIRLFDNHFINKGNKDIETCMQSALKGAVHSAPQHHIVSHETTDAITAVFFTGGTRQQYRFVSLTLQMSPWGCLEFPFFTASQWQLQLLESPPRENEMIYAADLHCSPKSVCFWLTA